MRSLFFYKRPGSPPISKGFPLHKLDVGAHSDRELAKLAGNSMHVRCVFVAIVAALAAADRSKVEEFLNQAQSHHSHLSHCSLICTADA